MQPLSSYTLADPKVMQNPYPYYERLRTEDPVHFDEGIRTWLVTRYEDIVALARDTEAYSDEMRVSAAIRSPFQAEVGAESANRFINRRLKDRSRRLLGIGAAFEDGYIESNTEVVVGETAAGLGDDLAGFCAPLREEFVLFGEAAGPAGDFDDDALIGYLLNQRARKGPHTRKQRRNIFLTAGIGGLSLTHQGGSILPFLDTTRLFDTARLLSNNGEMDGVPSFRTLLTVNSHAEFLLNCTDGCIKAGIRRRIFANDGEVNGTPRSIPMGEKNACYRAQNKVRQSQTVADCLTNLSY